MSNAARDGKPRPAADPTSPRSGPLRGMRVLSIDNYFAGNYGPQLLAMHGAEVIKIEQPGSGDPLRTDAPYLDAANKAYAHGVVRLMRDKSSLALDVRSEAGRQVFYRLVKEADVFWTNLRPTAAARLGIGPDILQALNAELVYASVSGFGLPSDVPAQFGDEPAFDIIIQALTGLMSRNADPDGTPAYSGLAVADQATSLFAAFGVMMALYARDRGDPAAVVDVAMVDSMLAFNEKTFTLFSMDGVVRPPRISATNSPFGAYRGQDGYVVIGVGGAILWERFCRAIGRTDLHERADLDTGIKRVAVENTIIRPAVEQWLAAYTVEEAGRILLEHQVPASPILDVDHPRLRAQGALRGVTAELELPDDRSLTIVQSPVRLSTQQVPKPGRPHDLGEDSDTVLRDWLKMGDDELQRLRDQGIIG
jgi:CoA:oxalate CoA-transferase